MFERMTNRARVLLPVLTLVLLPEQRFCCLPCHGRGASKGEGGDADDAAHSTKQSQIQTTDHRPQTTGHFQKTKMFLVVVWWW